MRQTPLVFLAFAQISSNHLAKLGQEMDAIHEALLPWQDRQRLEIRPRMSADLALISTMINELRERVFIFHYGGHAGDTALHLADGVNHAQSVAALFQFLPNIKLVFLNGCATKAQVEAFWAHGVNIVIATSVPVNDSRAQKLGTEFYAALAADMNIGQAFKKAALTLEAKGEFPNAYTGQRNLFVEAGAQETEGLEWDLYVKAGEEAALEWKLKDLPFLEEESELDLPQEETPALYQRLQKLNYSEHVPLLLRYLLRHDIGTFLIHGPPRYGQTWLANNRLTAFPMMDGLDLPRAIQLGSRVATQSELIEEIKKVLRFGRGFENLATEIESISQKLLDRLKNGPVLIRVHEVQDFLRNGFFTQFMKEFWQALAQRLEALKSEQAEQRFHKLVLLLIEEEGNFDEAHPQLIKEVSDTADHSKILLLPDIPAVNLAEFDNWLVANYADADTQFINQFSALNQDEKKAWLGDQGQMPPEAFMEKICDTFGYYFDVNGQGQWELVP
ncbi:MAG: CHAT domain-containing protein [Bacteroidota bacterium]